MLTAKQAWDGIASFEAHDIVRMRYQAAHGREPNAAAAREIAAPFIQARQYYLAAAGADRTVRPLLLYYGVVSLSRGLVLFLTRNLREASLAPSHGLSVSDWQTVLAADRPDISKLAVVVNGAGSFAELLNATGNRSLIRTGSSAVNHKAECGPVERGITLTLGELLAGLPDVIDQLKHWRTPQCIRFSVEPAEPGRGSIISVPRADYVDAQLVLDIVGPQHCEFVTEDAGKVVVRSFNGTAAGMFTDRIDEHFARIGDLYLARRYACGARLSKIAQLFAIAYILSMLVRYYPTSWMDLVRQRVSDAAVPTILRVIDCIEGLYPLIVLDFLEERI